MEKQLKLGVYIGRFQPFHKGHLSVIEQSLKECEHILILIGSSNLSRDIKNPFSYDERKRMILSSLVDLYGSDIETSISIKPLRDHFYAENIWVKQVHEEVSLVLSEKNLEFPILYGLSKDSSSYYLRYFEDYEKSFISQKYNVDATTIRNKYFDDSRYVLDPSYQMSSSYIGNLLTSASRDFLSGFSYTEEYKNLSEESSHIKEYKKMWESTPFPVLFVTVDSVVIRNGKILVVKRKINPGKGKYALPGGFVRPDDTLMESAIRELKEETRIKISKKILNVNLKDVKVFDHPNRSSRGRTITHAHFFDLSSISDPIEVKGGDDAAEAMWLDIAEFYKNENSFFEDHAQIIEYFILSRDGK